MCSVDGCTRKRCAKGLCSAHYQRLLTRGDPYATIPLGRRIAPKPCSVDGCERTVDSRGLCRAHYARWWKTGDTQPERPVGGYGRGTERKGYCKVKHPRYGWIREHRAVMQDFLGRELLPEESVHHRNGNPADNRIENLELWSSKHPAGQRVADLLPWAREIVDLYDGKLFP